MTDPHRGPGRAVDAGETAANETAATETVANQTVVSGGLALPGDLLHLPDWAPRGQGVVWLLLGWTADAPRRALLCPADPGEHVGPFDWATAEPLPPPPQEPGAVVPVLHGVVLRGELCCTVPVARLLDDGVRVVGQLDPAELPRVAAWVERLAAGRTAIARSGPAAGRLGQLADALPSPEQIELTERTARMMAVQGGRVEAVGERLARWRGFAQVISVGAGVVADALWRWAHRTDGASTITRLRALHHGRFVLSIAPHPARLTLDVETGAMPRGVATPGGDLQRCGGGGSFRFPLPAVTDTPGAVEIRDALRTLWVSFDDRPGLVVRLGGRAAGPIRATERSVAAVTGPARGVRER
ncbi:MAG: hypothetical protein IPM29_00205 [Planctomycetes bacterium]|nr:hypothetical protein [Planctomycetota bacterium]